jgi:hypothetical protein
MLYAIGVNFWFMPAKSKKGEPKNMSLIRPERELNR